MEQTFGVQSARIKSLILPASQSTTRYDSKFERGGEEEGNVDYQSQVCLIHPTQERYLN